MNQKQQAVAVLSGVERMRIKSLGAAGDVTGSAYHVITKRASVLVDCGLFQGEKVT